MNGPREMYGINPLFNYPTTTEKPENMYKIDSIYSNSQQGNSSTEMIDPDLLNLENRQENLLRQLENLSSKLQQIKQQITQVPSTNLDAAMESATLPATTKRLQHFVDAVVTAPTSHQPFGLLVLTKWLQERHKVLTLCHVHSSVDSLPEDKKSLFQNDGVQEFRRGEQEMLLTLIWSGAVSEPRLIVSPSKHSAIAVDVNIIRYLAGLIAPAYNFEDPVCQTMVDVWLDLAHHSVLNGNNKERQGVLRNLNSHLGKNAFLVGGTLSVADVGVLSALLQTESVSEFPTNVKRWFKSCSENRAVSQSLDALSVKQL